MMLPINAGLFGGGKNLYEPPASVNIPAGGGEITVAAPAPLPAQDDSRKFTLSVWVKRLSAYGSSGVMMTWGYFLYGKPLTFDTASGQIQSAYYSYAAGSWLTWKTEWAHTLGEWFHYVLAVDGTQAAASDRVKQYVNGVDVTDATPPTMPLDDSFSAFGGTYTPRLGTPGSASGANTRFAEFHLIDGQQLTPGEFGETAGGVWVPKEYGGTYGSAGFYWNFGDADPLADLAIDSSGNGSHGTVYGALSQSADTPTNPL